MPVKDSLIRSAIVPSLAAFVAVGLALFPAQALGQSCSGGYCGSGDDDTEVAKVEVTVSVSVSPKDGGTVFINDAEAGAGFTALQGDTLVLEAIPNSGYVFDGWSDWFDESDSRVEAPIYNHKTLTAHFVEVTAPRTARVQNTNTSVVTILEGTMALGPSGTALDEVAVQLRQPRALPSNGILLGDVYDLKPDGATFDPPIQISLPYDVDSLPSGVDEQSLRVAVFDPSTQDWNVLPSEVHTDQRTVVAEVSHFSEFAVVAEGQTADVPLITPGFSFSSLTITPATPAVGETTIVAVEASYAGSNAQARSNVFVTLDGQIVDEKEIVLSPGDQISVALTVRAPQEGSFVVAVNGLSETITVSGSAPSSVLFQAVTLAEQDRPGASAISSPALWSRWRTAVYAGGAIVLLILSVPVIGAFRRRLVRYRYDL